MKRLLPILLVLALAACGSTPSARLFAASEDFGALSLTVAHYGEDLPRCSPTVPPPKCSDQALIDRAIAAGEASRKALADARAAADANAASKANPLAPQGPSDDAVRAAVALADAKLAEYRAIVNEMKKSGVK